MQYDALSPTELSVMYRKAWKRFFAPVPEDFLAVSVAHATFYDMPEVQEMQVAVERVFAKVEVIARHWLQAQDSPWTMTWAWSGWKDINHWCFAGVMHTEAGQAS